MFGFLLTTCRNDKNIEMDKKIDLEIRKLEGEMTVALMSLVSIPAVSPLSVGGDEKKKAAFV